MGYGVSVNQSRAIYFCVESGGGGVDECVCACVCVWVEGREGGGQPISEITTTKRDTRVKAKGRKFVNLVTFWP